MNPPFIMDLDGTLMPSHAVDNDCYWAAVSDVFGGVDGSLDLSGFSNVTDVGILDEWCRRQLGRPPRSEETTEVRGRFLHRVEAAATLEPDPFAAFPGVSDWLESQPRGAVAIATGGWGHTARFKLAAAGLDRFDLPLASSDEAGNRPDIMRVAQQMLDVGWHEQRPTYLGDGAWDLAAARSLGWGFIGVAGGARADVLWQAGAERVVADFRELLAP